MNPARKPKKSAQPAKPPASKQVKRDTPSGQTSPSSSSTEPPREQMSDLKVEEGGGPRSPPPKVLNIVRSSKFRHIEGQTMHRSTYIDKIPKLNGTVPGDSNAFQVCTWLWLTSFPGFTG